MLTPSHPDWAAVYVLVEWLIRLLAVVIVPLRRPPATATAWLLLIFFQPVMGGVFYLFVGRPRAAKARQAKIDQLSAALAPIQAHLSTQHPAHPVTATLPDRWRPIAQLASHWRAFPIFDGNHISLIEELPRLVVRLAADIDAAQRSIHLLFYIAARDEQTEPVFAALLRAAARGVEVRLLIDDFGSKHCLAPLLALEAQGIRVARAFPRSKLPRRAARFDLRNHRKIVVIDGQIGYTGSMNLIRPDFKAPLIYEDIMLRIEGPVVLELQTVFAGDWYIERNILLTGAQYFPTPGRVGPSICLGLPSGPEYPDPVQQQILTALIHASVQSIRLVTPYFVPDEPTLIALKAAAQRGVEVELILADTLDQRLVQWAQESYYEELLAEGVMIRRYPNRFLHTKFGVFDDHLSLIGSANLDVRSNLINAEFGLIFFSPHMAELLNRLLHRYRESARLLTAEAWRLRTRPAMLRQNLARLATPLL
ncbi:cardiolipin synthase [Halothiobacillus sp. DCM-1]|uniref:cardiolipin synthase n=1 Tax=Halothiobacillus sp. DCM-1 TaxID=3112558 RepID=UPI003250DF69